MSPKISATALSRWCLRMASIRRRRQRRLILCGSILLNADFTSVHISDPPPELATGRNLARPLRCPAPPAVPDRVAGSAAPSHPKGQSAGAALRSRRVPDVPQDPAPSRNRSATCPGPVRLPTPPPQPVASPSASLPSRTSTSAAGSIFGLAIAACYILSPPPHSTYDSP